MADLKISQLTGATTPLAGTEVLPIVQSGATKQVSVANLTAGRTQTSNGIVQGSAATGYNFTANTPAAGMTSQLLNWYEEGAWTPTDGSGAGLTFTGTSGNCFYTRVGNLVTCVFALVYPSTASAVGAKIAGLPFTSKNTTNSVFGGYLTYTNSSLSISLLVGSSDTNINMYSNAGATISNVQLSTFTLRGLVTYMI